MKNTLIILASLALAGAVGAYFAKREIDKFVKDLDIFHDSF